MSGRTVRDRLDAHDRARKWRNRAMTGVLGLASLCAVVPLLLVFGYVLAQGFSSIRWDFLTQLPKPVGEAGGGIANAIVGSLLLIALASLAGIPWGVATGVYLSEYGRGKTARVLRFGVDMLASVPSILIGIFAYAALVVPMRHFSALAGGLALAIIMVPVVARTTEELLRLVPTHLREAGLGLGLPRWKVTLLIVVRGSLGGIATGVMLAVARAAGETAPLLFTALNNRFFTLRVDQPIASLPVQIYTYAISPYEDWHRQAWAAALLLVGFVLVLNLLTRLVLRRRGS
jgi:phosphate transport system permease protein